MNWLIDANPCPGVFYGTPAQDGFLLRIRTPGGQLQLSQGRAIATWMQQWRSDHLQLTNRGNLQLRSLQNAPSPQIFDQLKTLGLAARVPEVDQLRNIMASPTAGIDEGDRLDTRPWVQALDDYIQEHPHLAALPAKFSIGLDGGGSVAIGDRSRVAWEHRYNEIQLSAVDFPKSGGSVYFQLALGADKQLHHSGCLVPIQDTVEVVAALMQAYLDYLSHADPLPNSGRKPRLKHLLADWGIERYLQQVTGYLSQPLPQCPNLRLSPSPGAAHLGVHRQRQSGWSYLGVAVPLGQLNRQQFGQCLDVAEQFGSGELRLTPWQTLLLPNIADADVKTVLQHLDDAGLSGETSPLAIAACAGKPGCSAAATATQGDAQGLLEQLPQQLGLETPVNIHLTGCPKSCAQPSPAEITLLGTAPETYQLYLGNGRDSWKHDLGSVAVEDLSRDVSRVLRSYQRQRYSRDESLSDWVQRLERSGVQVQECLQ